MSLIAILPRRMAILVVPHLRNGTDWRARVQRMAALFLNHTELRRIQRFNYGCPRGAARPAERSKMRAAVRSHSGLWHALSGLP